MRAKINPEEIFYNHIKKVITNLLIDNPNYKNGYYHYEGCPGSGMKGDLLKDTKEHASYILKELENTKHLINL